MFRNRSQSADANDGRGSSKPSVLFISYDGLLDPLGPSQIIPYLLGIKEHPRAVHVLSFEKAERIGGADALRIRLNCQGIEWTCLRFTRGGGKLGKAWDLVRMHVVALAIVLRRSIGIVHCRGYLATQAGLLAKRVCGCRVIFDMRGLWPDERIDGGLWDLHKAADRVAYRYYKWLEKTLLTSADHVVALTERTLRELARLAPASKQPVNVIPCCADFDHFRPLTVNEKTRRRAALDIGPDELVLCYLGSFGTWYLVEEMLRFVRDAAQVRQDIRWLVITKDWGEREEAAIDRLGLDELRARIKIVSASRDEVPGLLGIADILLSFIKPAYSKLASSPTKLAEAFAAGVPTISNAGVGDLDDLIPALGAGIVVDLDSEMAWRDAVKRLDEVAAMGGERLRARARAQLDLTRAHAAYLNVYCGLDAQFSCRAHHRRSTIPTGTAQREPRC